MRVEIEKDRKFRKGEQMTEKEKMIAGMRFMTLIMMKNF